MKKKMIWAALLVCLLIGLFCGCAAAEDFVINANGVLTKYNGSDDVVTVPDNVTAIGGYAFEDCTGLTEINIPDTVTSIGDYAFSGCTSLTKVVLPSGLTAISNWCFNNCASLTEINIPDAVTSIESGAFRYCSALKSLTLPQGLQNLGSNAFLYCDQLSEVYIPDTLQTAGIYISNVARLRCSQGSAAAYALSKNGNDFCDNDLQMCYTYADRDGQLTGLTLKKYLGVAAKVTLPAGLTVIKSMAFSDCTTLQEVVIPETVIEIGYSAFDGCSSLSKIILPDGLTKIEFAVFFGCKALQVVTIPESVTEIEQNAFYGCTGLKALVLPQGLKKIGSNAFSNCSGLTYIDIPDGVETVGSWIADNSLQLRCSIGSSAALALSKDGNSFYAEDFQLRYTFDENGAQTGLILYKYTGAATKVTLPDGLTVIRDSAFSACTALQEIAIPETVIEIGYSAFDGCSSLSKIILPDGLTKIESSVFSGCTALQEVTIPESVTEIGQNVFYGCTGLKSLILPQGLKTIGSSAFKKCSSLTYIDIPDGVETVGNRIADDSLQLRCSIGSSAAITLSKGGNSFYVGDFQLCYTFDESGTQAGLILYKYTGAAAKVSLPDGLTVIEYRAFFGCTTLQEISIPESVTEISYDAFYGCTGLKAVILPRGLKTIASGAFGNCSSLTYIDIPDGIETVGNWIGDSLQLRCSMGSNAAILLSKSGNSFCADSFQLRYTFDDTGSQNGLILTHYLGDATELAVPEGVTVIGDSAFYENQSLTKIILPESVSTLESLSFCDCSALMELILPQGLKEIGSSAFSGCSALTSVDIPDGVETVGGYVANDNLKLRCSMGSSAAIALSKAECNFCADDFALRYSFDSTGAINGLIAMKYLGKATVVALTLPEGVTETDPYLLSSFYADNVMSLTLPEGFKKLNLQSFIWRKAIVFPETIQSVTIEDEWEEGEDIPLIFYCYHDTVAESYAQKRGISIVYLDGFQPKQTTIAMREYTELTVGTTLSLTDIAAAVPYMPEGCTLTAVSEDPSVLQVNGDGTISVIGKGNTTLKVSLSQYPDVTVSADFCCYIQPTSATAAKEVWIPAKASRDLLKKDLMILPADSGCPATLGIENWELVERPEDDFTLLAVNRGDTTLYFYVPGIGELTAQLHITARFSQLTFAQAETIVPTGAYAALCAQAVTPTHTYVNEYMTFASSAPSVAAVDENGVVHGVSAGKATITATSYNGLTATCTVTVQAGRELKLPAGLKKIDAEAFLNVSAQVAIVPDGCESIGARAFSGSTSLSMIEIPASVTFIAPDAFDSCTNVVIRTTPGSYASRYAAEHGLNCVTE